MISLSQYITESLVLESFTIAYPTYDAMIKDNNGFLSCVKRLKTDEEKKEFINFIQYITNKLTVPDVFKVDKEKKQAIFKLNYACADGINSFIDEYGGIPTESDKDVFIVGNLIIDCSDTKKYKVFFKTSGNKSKGIKMFELGSGVSDTKTKTVDQEQALCTLWNCYAESLDPKNTNNTPINLHSDLETLKKSFNTALNNRYNGGNKGSQWDNSWITSYIKVIQVLDGVIRNFLKDPKKDMETTNPMDISDYRMCVYGNQDEYNSGIGIAYKGFIEQFKKLYNVRKKDVFDPTDVLLYKQSEMSNIVSKLNNYKASNQDDLSKNKTRYVDEMFKTKLLFGISLKKIPKSLNAASYIVFNISPDTFNIGDVETYTKKEDTESTGNNYFVKAKGKFDLKGITIVDQKNNKEVDVDSTTSMQVMLRSFGSGIIAMDCTLTKRTTASIGKCPADIWRELFSDDKVDLNTSKNSKDLKINLQQYQKFINKELEVDKGTMRNGYQVNTDKYVLYGLTRIIRGALKEGPTCFPFILIH